MRGERWLAPPYIMFAGEVLCVGRGEGGRRASSKTASNIFNLLLIAWCREFAFSLILELILSTVSEETLADSANTRMSLEKLSISIRRSDKSP